MLPKPCPIFQNMNTFVGNHEGTGAPSRTTSAQHDPLTGTLTGAAPHSGSVSPEAAGAAHTALRLHSHGGSGNYVFSLAERARIAPGVLETT